MSEVEAVTLSIKRMREEIAALKSQNERLIQDNEDWKAIVESNNRNTKKLIEALRFYADVDSYGMASYECAPFLRDDEETVNNEFTGGKRARQVLRELGIKECGE